MQDAYRSLCIIQLVLLCPVVAVSHSLVLIRSHVDDEEIFKQSPPRGGHVVGKLSAHSNEALIGSVHERRLMWTWAALQLHPAKAAYTHVHVAPISHICILQVLGFCELALPM